jgi:PAS domain S-box-containing protein
MNPVPHIYVALASISFFSGCMQLYLHFRNKKDVDFLVCAILSFFLVISLIIDALCAAFAGSSMSGHLLLRYQLIFYHGVAICLLGAAYHLLKIRWKAYYLLIFSIFGLFILLSIFIPDRILFGTQDAIKQSSLVRGENSLMVNGGFTLWRILIDLNILAFLISVIQFLSKGSKSVSHKAIILLFLATGIIFFTAIFDQFIDLGDINFTYLIPFGFFLFYFIIIFVPLIYFTNDKVDQIDLIQQEQKWCRLIYESDIIVVGLNRMGQVEFINPYFYKLTGYHEDEVVGKDWFEFFIPPKDFFDVQSTFIEILEYDFHPQYYNPILTKNNGERMIRWFNIRSHNEQGIITGSLSIGIDVTDETKEKEAILEKLKKAEELIAVLTIKNDPEE